MINQPLELELIHILPSDTAGHSEMFENCNQLPDKYMTQR